MPTATIGSAGVVRLRAGRSVTFFAAGPQRRLSRGLLPRRDRLAPVAHAGPRRGDRAAVDSLRRGQPSGLRRLGPRAGTQGRRSCPRRRRADDRPRPSPLLGGRGLRRRAVCARVRLGARRSAGRARRREPARPPDGPGASPSLRYKVPLVPFGSPRVGPASPISACGRSASAPDLPAGDDRRLPRLPAPVGLRSRRAPHPGDALAWARRPARPACPHARAGGRDPGLARRASTARGGHFFYSRRLTEILGSLLPAVAAGASPPPDVAAPSRLTAATIRACGHRS